MINMYAVAENCVASVIMTKLKVMIDLHQDIYLYTVYISQTGTFSLHWKSRLRDSEVDIKRHMHPCPFELINSEIKNKMKFQSVKSDSTFDIFM